MEQRPPIQGLSLEELREAGDALMERAIAAFVGLSCIGLLMVECGLVYQFFRLIFS